MTSRDVRFWLVALVLALAAWWGSAGIASAESAWQEAGDSVVALLEQIPEQYAQGDLEGVEATIRAAYYEEFQVSGLEDEIKHRLGAERAKAFQSDLLDLRTLARQEAPAEEVESAVEDLIAQLNTDLVDLEQAPEVNDRWSRVAQGIVETANEALRLYEQGEVDAGFSEASRAYLEHYEAGGLEKATLTYLSSGRVAEVEAEFREIRMGIRNGEPVETVRSHVENLSAMVVEDATALDSLGAQESLGWSGFFASFLILLREGAEALLVVAAVITYVVKTGRREQLRGVYLGVVAAIVVSVLLAVLFNLLTSSAALGMMQELIEGVTGLLAAMMLIYISNWILSKSEGDAWQRFIDGTLDDRAEGGRWALFAVVFLAVAREGFETILFYIPVFGAAQTPADQFMVWAGLVAAVVVLAILFIAVRYFGVRLPLRPFFRWTSVFLGLLAITITGGAIKEFQDAMLVSATPVDGLPQITWLGFYPTVETILAQVLVTALIAVLMILQFRRSGSAGDQAPDTADLKESPPAPSPTATKGTQQ